MNRFITGRAKRLAAVGAISLAVAAGGCTATHDETAHPAPPVTGSAPTTSAAVPASPSAAGGGQLAASVSASTETDQEDVLEDLTQTVLGLESEAALATFSGDGSIYAVGGASINRAWSTLKVPLAIAALRANPQLTESAALAIRASDNSAALRLWEALGGGFGASLSIDAVLREFGDLETVTLPNATEGAGSYFGTTQWDVSQQVTFLSNFACSDDDSATQVSLLMGELEPEHRIGIAGVEGVRAKAGWGWDPDGQYTYRQMGFLESAKGVQAVALIVRGPSVAQVMEDIDRVSQQLDTDFSKLPFDPC